MKVHIAVSQNQHKLIVLQLKQKELRKFGIIYQNKSVVLVSLQMTYQLE